MGGGAEIERQSETEQKTLPAYTTFYLSTFAILRTIKQTIWRLCHEIAVPDAKFLILFWLDLVQKWKIPDAGRD